MIEIGKILIDASKAAIGVPAAAYAISSIGLNLQFGYTGLLNFGHVGFMLVGAYGTAITVDAGGPLWLGVIVGLLAAALLGLLLGIPTLRLRADYLAIVTIAAGEILRLVVRSTALDSIFNSVIGFQAFADDFFDLNPIPSGRYGPGRFSFDSRALWVLIVIWAVAILGTLIVRRLVRSPWGRVIRAIREDEEAVRSLGKNVFWHKLQSLMIGGAFGGMAGILLAIDQQNVNPDFFIPLLTFYAYTIVVLGGPGTVWGPILGSVMFWFLFEFFEELFFDIVEAGWLGSLVDVTDVGAIRFALFGLGLMALMAFRPQGVFGSREEQLIDG
jgi:branched-chain amino acid transport system permease protein